MPDNPELACHIIWSFYRPLSMSWPEVNLHPPTEIQLGSQENLYLNSALKI